MAASILERTNQNKEKTAGRGLATNAGATVFIWDIKHLN